MGNAAVGENVFLAYSLGMGIFITFVYDLFRIGRRVCAHNRFWISIEDILFWIFCAISVFYLMHTQSNGTLRWFAILGALAGMFLYKKTVSPFFVKWTSAVLLWIKKLLLHILRFIGRPFVFLAKKGKSVKRKAAQGGKRVAGFVKKRLTAFGKLLKIILCKQ